jgi:hypothetical protein
MTMIYDTQTMFSDGQAITVSAPSTNIYDCGPVTDIGTGQEATVSAVVTEAFAASGSATLTISLQTASDAAFTSPVTLLTSDAISKVTLTQGYQAFFAVIPRGCLRYLRLYYTVTTGPMTAGKVTSSLSLDGLLGAPPVRTGLGARV